MSEPERSQPPHYEVRSGRAARPANSRGAASALLGVVALFMAVLPVPAYFAWVPGGAAIVLGIIGMRTPRLSRANSITGVILGILALVVATAIVLR